MKLSVLILFVVMNVFTSFAQTESHEGHDHHEHPKNEIGVANSPVYYLNEKEFTYGMHLHYIRTIGDSKFGIGLGYEQIFDQTRRMQRSAGQIGRSRLAEYGYTNPR